MYALGLSVEIEVLKISSKFCASRDPNSDFKLYNYVIIKSLFCVFVIGTIYFKHVQSIRFLNYIFFSPVT